MYIIGCPGNKIERVPCLRRSCNATLSSVFDSFECGIRRERNLPKLRIIGGQVNLNLEFCSICNSPGHSDIYFFYQRVLTTDEMFSTMWKCVGIVRGLTKLKKN